MRSASPSPETSLPSVTGSSYSTSSTNSEMSRKSRARRRQLEKESTVTATSVTGSFSGLSEETSVEVSDVDFTQLTTTAAPRCSSKIPVLSSTARLCSLPAVDLSGSRIPRLSASSLCCTSLTCSDASRSSSTSFSGARLITDARVTARGFPDLLTEHEVSVYEVPEIEKEEGHKRLPVKIAAGVEDMQVEIAFGVEIDGESLSLSASVPGGRARA